MAWVIRSRRSVQDRPLPASIPAPASLPLPVFVALAGASLGIAVAFALAGAWPVLPFASLELAALAWAIRHFGRHARHATVSPAPISYAAARRPSHRSKQGRQATRIRKINQRRKPF